MKRKINKKLLIFGLPILAIGLVAAVLTYYAVITVSLNVNQPITVTGSLAQSVPCDAGDTCIGNAIRVDNSASSENTITIADNSIPEIDVNYVGKLEMDNKNANYERIADDRGGILYYFITGDELGYRFEAQGLDNVEYALIYYADHQDRFNVWGGSPAVLIDRGIASSGDLVLEGNTPIGDLPFITDWNVDGTPNYCGNANGFDDYEHCYGAKIWLVPMVDYDASGQTVYPNWHPGDWLFETDLIYYFDNINGEYTIGANSFVEFYPLFEVDPYLPAGSHLIEITIA